MAKKRKKKSAPIFPPETGENRMPSPALQSPADAAMASASFAGLGAVGSINEDQYNHPEVQKALDNMAKQIAEEVDEDCLNELRALIWGLKDAD